jgi:hypothetical protein
VEHRIYHGREVSATLKPWVDLGKLAASGQAPELIAACLKKQAAAEAQGEIPLWMDAFNVTLENLLLAAGVELVYAALPTEVIVTAGAVRGVVIGNKSGRQAILGRLVLDATATPVVARIAGAEFAPETAADFHFIRMMEMEGVWPLEDSTLEIPSELGITGNRLTIHSGYRGNGHVLIECPMELKTGKLDLEGMMQREIEARHGTMRVATYLVQNVPQFKDAKLGICAYELDVAMITARNLAEMKKALAMRHYMAQNIMVGTMDGDIYYLCNGRVPVRPAGCDPSRPMPGTGECEWQGIHPIEDLPQIENRLQGYMQNRNISPWVMLKDSPLTPEKFAAHPYLYNAARKPAHQNLLTAAKDVTVDQALGIAFSTEIYKADLWHERIRKTGANGEFARMILDWNRHSDADSQGALAYYLFKISLGERSKLVEPPDDLSDGDVRAAMDHAERHLKSDFSPGAVYGTLFRVGREASARNWPIGGGTVAAAGMATPRAIGFDKKGDIMLGRSGQTSTQAVILTKPPQSWMVIPLGESDHPDSPHFDDQAKKLFSHARAKPTYFLRRDELEKHATALEELTY